MDLTGGIGKRYGCISAVLLCCMLIHIFLFSFREITVTSPLQDKGSIYIADTINVISRSAVTQRTTDYRSLSHILNDNSVSMLHAVPALRSGVLSYAGFITPDTGTGTLPESVPSTNIVSRK
ncbi:MAG: hypothetical protein K6E42_03565 [Synergistes sp.]|nr:hypothetical protein [Synergistes sp.]